jgi:hypothetical protein
MMVPNRAGGNIMKKEERENLREEWGRRLRERKESCLSQAEYCRINNVKVGQFHY